VLTAILLAVVIYGERLLFGTTYVWWITVAGAAGALGLSVIAILLRLSLPALGAAVLACTLVAMLTVPLWASLRAVRENVTDSNPLGLLPAKELDPLSSYLLAHQGNTRFEVVVDSASKMGALVVKDARPVLPLTTTKGRVVTPTARLRTLIGEGQVRYAFLTAFCGPPSERPSAACSAPVLWIRAHGRDISRLAGLRDGTLYLLPGARPLPGEQARTRRGGSRRHGAGGTRT
jgi:hypothetical protein